MPKTLSISARLFLCFSTLAVYTSRAAEIPAKLEKKSLEIYTLSALIQKAERIVLAEIGPVDSKDSGRVTLSVQETLKAPENDPKYISPERLKRAQALLDNEKSDLPPLSETGAPKKVYVQAIENLKLPPEGTQALFFLWDVADKNPSGGPAVSYQLSHPQCIYDSEALPRLKAALNHPRESAETRYLRDSDRVMAERIRQRETDATLWQAKSGDVVSGLAITAHRAVLSVRKDNSFSITTRVENTRSRPQAIYDGPAGGYGVILRKSGDADESAPLVFRAALKAAVPGLDNKILELLDATDFSSIPGGKTISKELSFDTASFPVLAKLSGQYTVSAFYTSKYEGKGLDLSDPIWTGTVLSAPIPIEFRYPKK